MILEVEHNNFLFVFTSTSLNTCDVTRTHMITAKTRKMGEQRFLGEKDFLVKIQWLFLRTQLDELMKTQQRLHDEYDAPVDEDEPMQYNPIGRVFNHREFTEPRQDNRWLAFPPLDRGYMWVGRAPPRQRFSNDE